MSTYNQVIEGLKILSSYAQDGLETNEVQSGHDIIYAGSNETLITKSDSEKLDELGWFYNEKFACWCRYT